MTYPFSSPLPIGAGQAGEPPEFYERQQSDELCGHVGMPPTAVCVLRQRPSAEHWAVYCPCCGLSGWDEPGHDEPMRCPYCGVDALPDDREDA